MGSRDLASAALDDVVRAAHASADRACHARSLSWIAHVEGNPARRHLLLAHLGDPLELAREHVTAAFTPLSDTVPHAQSPLTTETSSLSHLGSASATPTAVQRTRAVLNACIPTADRRVAKLLLAAAAWSSFGDGASALASAKLALHVAEAESCGRVTTERVQAACAVASLLAEHCGDHSGALSLLDSTAAEARSSCAKLQQAESSLANGSKNLTGCDNFGTTSISAELDALSQTAAWVSFGRAERRGDVREAERALRRLEATANCEGGAGSGSGGGVDPGGRADAMLDALEARARLGLLTSDLPRAARSAHDLCRKAARAVRPARVVKALTIAARAFLSARAPASALHAALAGVSLAHGFGLEAARAGAVCMLALCMAALSYERQGAEGGESVERAEYGGSHGDGADLAMRACNLVDGLLTCGMNGCIGGGGKQGRAMGNDSTADVLKTKAQCGMALAAARQMKPDESVVALLRRALVLYSRSGHALCVGRCWYLLARVHDARMEVNARNAAAKRFNAATRATHRREINLFS